MNELQIMPTGVPNLDTILGGGVPAYSLNILAGKPGTGKTILAQQILFNYVRAYPDARALYLTTLSEPTIKVLRYMKHFSFFDADIFGERLLYRDLGRFIRDHPLTALVEYIMSLITTNRPDIVVLDSFKVIKDLPEDANTFRHFCYDLSVQFAAARCTTFLLGEYSRAEVGEGAEFAVADGIFYLFRASQQGEQQRFLEVEKLRGGVAQATPFPFVITSNGVQMLASNLGFKMGESETRSEDTAMATGITGLDALLRGGIPIGHSVILCGVSGTGKTTFAMQFLVHGALKGERGLLFSCEEPPQRLRRMAHGFNWDLRTLEEQGLIRIHYIPQTDIHIEEFFDLIVREMEAFQARRLVMDSFSVFLYRANDPATQRDWALNLKALIQQHEAVGLLVSDIPSNLPYNRNTSFGIEESVADATIVLSTDIHGRQRRRYLEVYKMRATDHVPGQHRFDITGHGIEVLYLSPVQPDTARQPQPLVFKPLQTMFPDGPYYGSSWLMQGEEGVGKSTFVYQFAAEGLQCGESVLLIATDMTTYQVQQEMRYWHIPVDDMLRTRQLVILDTHPILGKEYVSLGDIERLLYDIMRHQQAMPLPCRVIIDSIIPLALQYTAAEFLSFIEQKNHLLRLPDVVLMDVIMPGVLNEHLSYSLRNHYDAVLDICLTEDETSRHNGFEQRVLRLNKARGMNARVHSFPYVLRPGEGVILHTGAPDGEREPS